MFAAVLFGVVDANAAREPADYGAELGARIAARLEAANARGNFDEVVDAGERFEGQVEPMAPTSYEIAYALNRMGDVDAALNAYDRALSLDPRHVAALYDRGELHLAAGRDALARADFEAAAAERTDHWAVHFRLAHVAGRSADRAAFDAHLTEALRHGFDFRTVIEDDEWRGFAVHPELGPVLARLIVVYSDPKILEQLREVP